MWLLLVKFRYCHADDVVNSDAQQRINMIFSFFVVNIDANVDPYFLHIYATSIEIAAYKITWHILQLDNYAKFIMKSKCIYRTESMILCLFKMCIEMKV